MAIYDQCILTTMMNWNAKDQHMAFQEFRDIAELYLKVKDITGKIMWRHIILLHKMESIWIHQGQEKRPL